MKIVFYILIKSFFLNDCVDQFFIGNWTFCDSTGLYGEIYFKENYFEMIYEGNGNLNTFYDYKVNNDTLFFNLEENQTINYKGYFEYISQEKIIFYFKYNQDKDWSYFKLYKLNAILPKNDKQKKYDDYINRLKNAECKKTCH